MVCNGIHRHGKSEDVTGRHKHKQKQLGSANYLPGDRAQQNPRRITHIEHLRIAPFELPDHISRVGCQ